MHRRDRWGAVGRDGSSSLARFCDHALNLLYPPLCTACLHVGRAPFCLGCQAFVESSGPFLVHGARSAVALWVYGGPLREAIYRMKYGGRPELAYSLGRAMRDGLRHLPKVDVVVPVPLSKTKLRQRGYNQARELARGLDLPVDPSGLVRLPGRQQQVGLARKARASNIAFAFRASKRLFGRQVLVVDDVVTTGATVRSAAEALQHVGVKAVDVLSLARTEAHT